MSSLPSPPRVWYADVTGYQWLVLAIASLGWVFDVFEGQIFVASMNEVMKDLATDASGATKDLYNNLALAAFLAGGALGGIVFGALGDRIGRARTMSLTILVYSLFTCLTAASQEVWHVVLLRFLVALGVGGEWAVASAMVSEVFPPRARAWSGAIFHGSSVLGTYLAIAAGQLLVNNPAVGWRMAFLVGALPALLTLWIRWQLKEPETWVADQAAHSKGERGDVSPPGDDVAPNHRGDLRPPARPAGSIMDLFSREWRTHTAVGFSLAVVGLATFWGVHIYGKEFMRRRAETEVKQRATPLELASSAEREAVQKELKRHELWGMFLATTGGGLGLVSFGPLCEWLGRRRAFLLYHLGGLVMGVLMFSTYRFWSDGVLIGLLMVFGFWTLGMHAGYAIYFPELFPTRLRSLGSGFCFNCARFTTAGILVIHGVLGKLGVSFETEGISLSLLFLLGLVIVPFGPETKGARLAS